MAASDANRTLDGAPRGRTWAPVGELIDATRRLGDGDASVHPSTRAPGPFAAVSGFNRMAERLEEEDERRRRLLADNRT